MINKIKSFLNRFNIKFLKGDGENYSEILTDNYVDILKDHPAYIRFYCSSHFATMKLVEILLSCNYNSSVYCENDGSYKVTVIKDTERRISKLIDDGLINNKYFRDQIFV